MQDMPDMIEQAKAVLEMNDRGNYTQPAHGLYPHQWLWDSCFVAIGLRHLDVDRAKRELLSLLRGQWRANGGPQHDDTGGHEPIGNLRDVELAAAQ